MRLPVLAAALYAATLSVPSAAQDPMTAPQYPETRRGDTAETLFGETIADPYRWLENDVRNDPEVADWVERQNAVTDAYLAGLPARAWFKRRIGELYDYERFSVPVKRGNRYFYTRNSGLQNQSPLYVREGLGGDAGDQSGENIAAAAGGHGGGAGGVDPNFAVGGGDHGALAFQ